MVLPDQLKSLGFLVVEDNAFTAMELCRMLRTLGAFNIEVASEGREALRKLGTMSPEPRVVLVDLRMPGMGGIELLDRLAERKYAGHVIICSGVDAETLAAVEDQARASGLKMKPSIEKPADKHALAAALGELAS
jgi:CheY-like chemotaxis protein